MALIVSVVQEGHGMVVLFPAVDPSHGITIKAGEKPDGIEATPDGLVRFDLEEKVAPRRFA